MLVQLTAFVKLAINNDSSTTSTKQNIPTVYSTVSAGIATYY